MQVVIAPAVAALSDGEALCQTGAHSGVPLVFGQSMNEIVPVKMAVSADAAAMKTVAGSFGVLVAATF